MKHPLPYIPLIRIFTAIWYAGCTTEDTDPTPADPRLAFEGIWRVTETGNRLTYEAEIVLDQKALNGGVFIYNFANAGSSSVPAYAYVSGTTITLEVNQVIGDDWVINGSGILTNEVINWPYTLNDGANLHQIKATFTRP